MKKAPPVKAKVPPKKAVPKPIQKKSLPVPKPKPMQNKIEKKVVPKNIAKKDVPPDQKKFEIATNKMNVHNRGLIQEFKLLHEDIVAHWAPPPGVSLRDGCQITVHVDWKGNVKQMIVDKSSGVLMYDSCARKVLYDIEMPRWTWGKELTVTFNQ